MEIKIGQVGLIVAGDEVGRYIKVLDDRQSTGGFLILTATDQAMSDGYDNWVEDEKSLSRYFRESHWKIDWLQKT